MKILIVDNDRVLTRLLFEELRKKGHEVVTATDGVEAFQLIKDSLFDILFIDYVMPHMDGRTLCKFVRKTPELSQLFIVLISAIAAEEWEDFREIGANVYLAKGQFEELKKNIFWILKNKELAASRCTQGEIIGLSNVYPRNITKELLVSKHHFQLILNTMSQGVLELNEKGQIVYANPAVISLFNTTEMEMIGNNFIEIFSNGEKERVKNIWTDTAGATRKIDFKNPLRIQESLATLEIATINTNKSQKSDIAIFTDITKHKEVEKEVKNSNKFLSQVLNSSFSTSILSTDLQQTVRFWNKGAENIFGYKADDVLGEKIAILYPTQEEIQQATELREKIRRDKKEVSTEIREITKDGKEKWIKANLSPILDDNENVIGIQGMGEDITEKKMFEKALIESEMKFRAIFECAKDAIFIKDDMLRFTLVNPAMESMLKLSAEQLHGKTEDEIFHSGSILGSEINELKVLSGKIVEEDVVLNQNSTIRNLNIIKVPLRNDKSKITGILGISRDISDLITMERHLNQTYKMEALGTLAGGIAHDFNNILSSIIGFTELTLDDVPKDTILERNLNEIYSAGKRARDLVKQILAFARQTDEEISPVQIDLIAKEVINFLQSAIPSNIQIRQNIESQSLIMGSPTQLHRVFMNLCTNAAQAMDESGGIIEISLKEVIFEQEKNTGRKHCLRPGEYIEIMISDTGLGISHELMDSIFEPYFTTKQIGDGTGMGLAMVKGIVESYGGKIKANSRVGEGSTFTLYLPTIKNPNVHLANRTEVLPMGTERVLFVDDESTIVDMGEQILTRLGYKVTSRTSSIDALELFRSKSNDFDLIITDMTMPNMTGDELSIELMKIKPAIPIIMCTGYSKKISDETASKIGIKAFAYKPMVKAELAKIVRKVLDERHQRL